MMPASQGSAVSISSWRCMSSQVGKTATSPAIQKKGTSGTPRMLRPSTGTGGAPRPSSQP